MAEAEPVALARSAVDRFVRTSPTERDVSSVTELLRLLVRDPESGVALHFSGRNRTDNVQAAWTPDGRWRVVFQRSASGVNVLSIEPEKK